MKPARIEVINNFLAVAWDDGRESAYDLMALRHACPCAGCKGEKTVMSEYKPLPPVYTPESFVLTGYHFVGGYGIQLNWKDGHSAGSYSFDYLRRLETKDENH